MANIANTRADNPSDRADHEGGSAHGQSLGRAMNHVNNFPSHLVCMVHVAPGQGKVLCVTPHHDANAEWDEHGCYVIDRWDNTEQIRKDFNADY
jgi:hypothetical protein